MSNSKRICLQSGHKGRTSGAVGAPGEQKWNAEIVPKIAKKLEEKGVEVYQTDAYAYNDPKVTTTDWDLFLSVHYDADIYNERGGFVDHPAPDADFATDESQRIVDVMNSIYFDKTGIPYRPERSNKNTRYYYMWKHLTADTPCALIEAGVGWRTPEDHHTLWFEQEKVSGAIAEGVLRALGVETDPIEPEDDPLEECLAKHTKLINELEEIKKTHIPENEVNERIEKAVKKAEKACNEQCKKEKYQQLSEISESLNGYEGEVTVESLKNSIYQREANRKELKERIEELENQQSNSLFKLIEKILKLFSEGS